MKWEIFQSIPAGRANTVYNKIPGNRNIIVRQIDCGHGSVWKAEGFLAGVAVEMKMHVIRICTTAVIGT